MTRTGPTDSRLVAPIIVKERDGPLYIFPELYFAQWDLEDQDIDRYMAWDSQGARLKMSSGPRRSVVFHVDPLQRSTATESELRALLVDALSREGMSVQALPRMSLVDLIDQATPFYEVRWDRRGLFQRLMGWIRGMMAPESGAN
jgi:hypothetical protein